MAKRIAVLAVNPVNGLGLFQYLLKFLRKSDYLPCVCSCGNY